MVIYKKKQNHLIAFCSFLFFPRRQKQHADTDTRDDGVLNQRNKPDRSLAEDIRLIKRIASAQINTYITTRDLT